MSFKRRPFKPTRVMREASAQTPAWIENHEGSARERHLRVTEKERRRARNRMARQSRKGNR